MNSPVILLSSENESSICFLNFNVFNFFLKRQPLGSLMWMASVSLALDFVATSAVS